MGNSISVKQSKKQRDNKVKVGVYDSKYATNDISVKSITVDRKNIISPKLEWIIMSSITNELKLTSNVSLIKNNSKNAYFNSIAYTLKNEYELKNEFKENKNKTQQRINNAATIHKPKNRVFIVGEYYNNHNSKDKEKQLLSDELRINLLKELDKLSKDKRIAYDIRNANSCQYLTSQKPYLFGKYGYNTLDTAALIHDLIDPFKYIYNHCLWIPSIFNIKYSMNKCEIETEILNLDRVKYYKLYDIIASIFYSIYPLFENVLHRQLQREKVIVKSMKYILSKPGDIYLGRMHREGMGENIECVAIYYPKMDKNIIGGELELTAIDPFYVHKKIKIGINEGDLIVFSNQCFHRLVGIQYPGKYDDEKEYKPLIRTILAFFIIEPEEGIVTMENRNEVNANYSDLDINLSFNCINIIKYWCRLYWMDDNRYFNDKIFELEFFYNLVELFICGDEHYIYNQRAEFRKNRFCSMKMPNAPPKGSNMKFDCWDERVLQQEPVVDEGLNQPSTIEPNEDPFRQNDDFYFDHTNL